MWILPSKHKAYGHEDHDRIGREQGVRALSGRSAARDVIVTKESRPVAVTVSFQDWEELTKLRIKHGIAQGLDDIKSGRFEEVSDTSTAARLARFKDRSSSAA